MVALNKTLFDILTRNHSGLCIFDTEKVLYGDNATELSPQYAKLLTFRKEQDLNNADQPSVFVKFFPIVVNGDLLGGMIVRDNSTNSVDLVGRNLVKFFSDYLG